MNEQQAESLLYLLSIQICRVTAIFFRSKLTYQQTSLHYCAATPKYVMHGQGSECLSNWTSLTEPLACTTYANRKYCWCLYKLPAACMKQPAPCLQHAAWRLHCTSAYICYPRPGINNAADWPQAADVADNHAVTQSDVPRCYVCRYLQTIGPCGSY